MRQKFGDAVDGVIGYASEDVFKPGEGLDIHALTRSDEAAQHGRCPAADVATKKHPVAATHRHTTNAALGACVVDFQPSVIVFTLRVDTPCMYISSIAATSA